MNEELAIKQEQMRERWKHGTPPPEQPKRIRGPYKSYPCKCGGRIIHGNCRTCRQTLLDYTEFKRETSE